MYVTLSKHLNDTDLKRRDVDGHFGQVMCVYKQTLQWYSCAQVRLQLSSEVAQGRFFDLQM